jgi:hypothetical protein
MQTTLKKSYRKLHQLKRQYIPYNSRFQPRKIVADSIDHHQDTEGKHFEQLVLSHEQKVVLPISQAHKKALFQPAVVDAFDSKTHSFVSNIKKFVNIIPNGRLYSDNLFIVWLMTQDNVLLADCSFQFSRGYPLDPEQGKLIRQRFFKKPQQIAGTVCSLLNGGGGSGNYFHWMIDVLPRLQLLKEADLFSEIDYFVVPDYSSEFQKSTLNVFGITEKQVIICKAGLHLQAECLIATSHPRGHRSLLTPQWVSYFHREHFLKLIEQEKPTASRVYISRQDSKLRPIYNEEELIDYLRAKGFAIVRLSDLSFLEKIRVFHQAEVLVGARGAGLTNLLYSRAGMRFLEIIGRDLGNTNYYNLGYNSGVEYDFVLCEKGNRPLKNRKQIVTAGFTADLEQIAHKVERMLE